MKVKITLLFFLLLTKSALFAQPAIQWQKSLGGTSNDDGYGIAGTNDGGCIVVGSSSSFDGDVTGNQGNEDGWIVKLDMNGDIEWERTVGGSSTDFLSAITLTPDAGYIVLGSTQSDDGDVTNYHGMGSAMIWVIKIDSLGNIEWNNCYGGTNFDYPRGRITLTSDGGYVFCVNTQSDDGDITGYHPGPTPFGFYGDIWIVKIDSIGNLQKQRCLGGSYRETPCGIFQTPDDGYIVCGETWGSSDGDVIGNTDTAFSSPVTIVSIWLVKLDSRFNIVWQKTYGGSREDAALGLELTDDYGYTFAGLTSSNDGDVIGYHGDTAGSAKNIWLVHVDSSGIIQWQNCFGGDSCTIINPGRLTSTSNGGYAVTGEFILYDSDFPSYHVDPLNPLSTDYIVVETDSIGNLQYQKCFGSYTFDTGKDIDKAPNNGLFVVGSSQGNNGDVSGHHGSLIFSDIWVFKLASPASNIIQHEVLLHAFKVYPNPVSANAKITFYLPAENWVSVKIYDILGKEIITLMNENLNAGFQQLNWNCTAEEQQAVSNGVYFARISAGEYTQATKLIVNK